MDDWFSFYWFKPSTITAFEWGNSYFLWLLLAIPLLFFLKWVFGSHQKNTISLSIENLRETTNYFAWLRYTIPFFFTLGMCMLILAMARPQLENTTADNYGNGIDIALAIDISESMTAKDLIPNRLEAAKKIAIDFLRKRKQDRVALVAFAGETTSLSPLTTDYEVLTNQLQNLNTSMIKTSGTALGMALASCINKLRDVPGKSKVAILISDGDNTAGSIDPEIALELAKTFGIRVYTIAIGKDSDVEKVDLKTMNLLATGSKGQFFKATDNTVLEKVFEKIDALEKTRFEFSGEKAMIDHYYTYLNWSIFFILLSLFLSKSFFGNILED
jgi:Ca-activated chloride channel homolog